MKINQYAKIFMKFFPKIFLRYAAWERGINLKKLSHAEKLFWDCQRIGIRFLKDGNQGFILFLDNRFSLWFFKKGDHFVFDGYEIGEYED